MDIYLSPIYIIFAGLFLIILISKVGTPTALISSVALALIVYTLYLHTSMFSSEYSNISGSAWLHNLAPTLLISAVLLMSLAYIIFFFKKDVKTDYKKFLPETSWNPTLPALPKINAMNPFAPTKTSAPLTKSEERNYISALNRLI